MVKRFSRKHVTKEDNFSYLLVALIFLLFSSACVEQFFARTTLGQTLVLILTIISMSIGVWSIQSSKLAFKGSLGLVLATMIISGLVNFFNFAQLEFFHLLFMLVFFVTTLKIAAEQALFSGNITKNNIIGSICIFLLLGLIWTISFLMVAEFIPNSFSGLKGTNWTDNFPDLVYFSFVTLTTLGFGDVLPLSPIARFLVYIEAVIGVFYMAIVVSSLVGAALNNKSKA
ncbi:potassium channel protein [Psychromonas sp. RZ22]|uniref:potassium channel family protein n=1 Tax=Psychromonas algarum TaxID=2555643 RepID=UPI00106773F2|nr:ion channel [Psychromonas sp. RZ22]TEW56839.1 potassium channel protein [Psychromonas sp. RZ22]